MSDAALEEDLDAAEDAELQEALEASREPEEPKAPEPVDVEEGKFYKRDLPDQCVAFASPRGRACFESALESGGLEGFFDLIAQFHTQNEPAYCGLATLTMALNSLQVDPGRAWKGVWRWYDESLLDCCKDLREVQLDGISLEEFVCLAACNGLSADTRRARIGEDETMEPGGFVQHSATCGNTGAGCHALIKNGTLADLRKTVVQACGASDVVLAATYSRRGLGQTGDGHFSPVSGYDAPSDQVLLLDVARFKYPPHWVPLPLLYAAMQAVDGKTSKARGWCLLSRSSSVPVEGDLTQASAILNSITGGKASKHTDLPGPKKPSSSKKSGGSSRKSGDAKQPSARKPAARKRKAAPDKCDWCNGADHSAAGPKGARTLCPPCGAKFAAGAGPPTMDLATGKFPCRVAGCSSEFDTAAALSSHRRHCDGGTWTCDWCACPVEKAGRKNPGPNGPATLCGPCGGRFRSGATGPPTRDADGGFVCDACGRVHETLGGLAAHARGCDGGAWRCGWCDASLAQVGHRRNPGPDGPATLCGPCGGRWRGGATGPPTRDARGRYVCDECGSAHETIAGLAGHRRFCDKGLSTLVEPDDELVDCLGLGDLEEAAFSVGEKVEAFWKSDREGPAWHAATVFKVQKHAFEVEWASEPNVYNRVPAKHVRALGVKQVEGGDAITWGGSSLSIAKGGPEVTHKALAAWDYACYSASRIDKGWDGEALVKALQGNAEASWCHVSQQAAEAALTKGSSFAAYELGLLDGGRPRGALDRLHTTLVETLVAKACDPKVPAIPRSAPGFQATLRRNFKQGAARAEAPVMALDGCDAAGRRARQLAADEAAISVAEAVDDLKAVVRTGDWYARLLALARCVLARRRHDARCGAYERPGGPAPELGDKPWPLDARAAEDARVFVTKDADRRKRDQREGRQRRGRGDVGDLAGDPAGARACETLLDAARADGLGGFTPWTDLTVGERCAVAAALSSLLVMRGKADADRALEALRTLGKLKRGAPPPLPPLVYDIPDRLHATVCGVYVTPGGTLAAVVDGAPRKRLKVVAKLGGVSVAPPPAVVPQGPASNRFETIRGAVGLFRRTPLGKDRDGRTYWALGERYDVLWRCDAGAWSMCCDVGHFQAFCASLGRTAGERLLKRVLLKLTPAFTFKVEGVACSLCGAAPPNGQLLLCDGATCEEEWCFSCAGVTRVPDGDWKCRGCAPPSAEVAAQKWAQCDACAKWRRLPSHIVLRNLPARWTCDMNVWDGDRAACDAAADDRPQGSAFRAQSGSIIFDGGA